MGAIEAIRQKLNRNLIDFQSKATLPSARKERRHWPAHSKIPSSIGTGNEESKLTLRARAPSFDSASRNAAERMTSNLDKLCELQITVVETTGAASQRLVGRIVSEGLLMAIFPMKLLVIRSIPEAASAYQDLNARRLRMAFEDATNFWTETQKLMHAAQLGRMQFFGEGPRAVNS